MTLWITLFLIGLVQILIASVQGFNPLAADNVAVYFGHSVGNTNASLPAVCNSSSVDIVILGFVRGFNGADVLPTFDIVKGCKSTTANGLQFASNCLAFATQISACQNAGKKILLSVGGSSSNTSFSSADNATLAAHTLWDFFGSGSSINRARPFGNVAVDGFDIDHEQGSTEYYDTFVSTLRLLYTNASKDYYISASPSCANSTVIYPINFFSYLDFLWPRFYNAQSCNTASLHFGASLIAWNDQLNSQVGSSALFPRLLVGALNFDSGVVNNGYLPPSNFTDVIISASCCVRDRFGGVMLWDGTNGLETMEDGQNFLDITKSALTDEADWLSAGGSNNGEMQYAMTSPAFQFF